MSNLVPIVIIGGVAYTLVGGVARPAPPTSGPLTDPATVAAKTKYAIAQSIRISGATRVTGGGITFSEPTNKAIDPELQKKLDAIEAECRKQYDNASDVAKVEAIDSINQNLGTDLPLDSDLSWEAISMAAYGAAGAAAGAYVCGPVCGKVGALAAAYLGAKLNDLLAKTYDELTKDLVGGEQSITSYRNSYEAWKKSRLANGKTATDQEWQAFRDARGAEVFESDFDDKIIIGVVPV